MSVGEGVRQLEFSYTAGGHTKWKTVFEKTIKTEHASPYNPAISLLDTYFT